jgi:hypothetical protein
MNPPIQYVICLRNDGVPASLECRKIYELLPDPAAELAGMSRIIDESGEDYLYPSAWFAPIALTNELQTALRLAS